MEIRSGCPTYLTAGLPGKETPRQSPRYNTGSEPDVGRRVGLREEPPMQTEVGKSRVVSVIVTEKWLVLIITVRKPGITQETNLGGPMRKLLDWFTEVGRLPTP